MPSAIQAGLVVEWGWVTNLAAVKVEIEVVVDEAVVEGEQEVVAAGGSYILFKNAQRVAFKVSLSQQVRFFYCVENDEISKVYKTQFCSGLYQSCARYKIRNQKNIPDNLLPDGSLLH
jgi:hypothetical protein